MTDPTHVVVVDGVVITSVLMDTDTAQQFRDLGFVEMLWPGGQLVDVTDLDPQPTMGWTYDGATFTPPEPPAEAPPADPPAPELEPAQA